MTTTAGTATTRLERRLAAYRAGRTAVAADPAAARSSARAHSSELAARLAAAIDADVVTSDLGTIVRRDVGSVPMEIDRARLASLPGQPPAEVPLICLYT
jgi:hypothetical protein